MKDGRTMVRSSCVNGLEGCDVAGAKGSTAVADSISISVTEDAPRSADDAERATLLTAWRSCPGDQVPCAHEWRAFAHGILLAHTQAGLFSACYREGRKPLSARLVSEPGLRCSAHDATLGCVVLMFQCAAAADIWDMIC